jgi:hypothetical protein
MKRLLTLVLVSLIASIVFAGITDNTVVSYNSAFALGQKTSILSGLVSPFPSFRFRKSKPAIRALAEFFCPTPGL